MTPSVQRTANSFRDPDGILLKESEKFYRVILPEAKSAVLELMEKPFFQNWAQERKWIGARLLTKEELARMTWNVPEGSLIVAHEAIPFTSYPSEWTRGMLKMAALLELDLQLEALNNGYLLKDATPFNVLWHGNQSLHVDWLSLQKRSKGLFVWRAYGQFLRTFLYPLFASQYFGVSLTNVFVGNQDGLNDDVLWEMSSWLRKSTPLFFKYVTVPHFLKRFEQPSDRPSYNTFDNDERALWVMHRLTSQLRNAIESIRVSASKSDWKTYSQFHLVMTDQDRLEKEQWIAKGLKTQLPKSILDIGCNTGELSDLAIEAGTSVVAIDSDVGVVERLWERHRNTRRTLLPLIVDIAQPTPATGWKNQETEAFLKRCTGKFDCVWALSLIHHLLVRNRIPLDSIFEVFAQLTTDQLWIEYVDPSDGMFKKMNTAKDDWRYLNKGFFEASAERWFKIQSVDRVGTTERWLYRMKRITGTTGPR